jgi:hypothetical protein
VLSSIELVSYGWGVNLTMDQTRIAGTVLESNPEGRKPNIPD